MNTRIFLVVVLSLFASGAFADETFWKSNRGQFVVSFESELTPLQINTLHAWRVHIKTTLGEPVTGAAVTVSGGMPLHDHGLPTRPRVTAELGDGAYRLEGMRFHMAGQWEITLLITVGDIKDTVVISLTL
jgi:hypothetical protein